MHLNLDNYTGAIIQLRQFIYTGIEILRWIGHGRQNMNIAPLQKSVTFVQ